MWVLLVVCGLVVVSMHVGLAGQLMGFVVVVLSCGAVGFMLFSSCRWQALGCFFFFFTGI